jgi:hypothetical protein
MGDYQVGSVRGLGKILLAYSTNRNVVTYYKEDQPPLNEEYFDDSADNDFCDNYFVLH